MCPWGGNISFNNPRSKSMVWEKDCGSYRSVWPSVGWKALRLSNPSVLKSCQENWRIFMSVLIWIWICPFYQSFCCCWCLCYVCTMPQMILYMTNRWYLLIDWLIWFYLSFICWFWVMCRCSCSGMDEIFAQHLAMWLSQIRKILVQAECLRCP